MSEVYIVFKEPGYVGNIELCTTHKRQAEDYCDMMNDMSTHTVYYVAIKELEGDTDESA